jgi:protein disulfide-isomerase A1
LVVSRGHVRLQVDHPAVNIRGFPTLKFFPAGSRKADVLDYEGARDLAGMTEFLKENAAIPFTLGEQDNDEL